MSDRTKDFTSKNERYIGVYQCPVHKNIHTLTIEFADGGGTRITPAKCCHNQYGKLITRWPISRIGAELINELEVAMSALKERTP